MPTTRLRSRLAATALAVAAGGAFLVAAPAAQAVQTDDFVLTAVGSSRVLEAAPGAGTVTAWVQVVNRTAGPLHLDLAAVEATRSPEGVFAFGDPGRGFASEVTLQSTAVDLAPQGQQVVQVDIRTPDEQGAERYAAVAATAGQADEAGLSVLPRLAVLIHLSGSTEAVPQALVGNPAPPARVLPVLAVAAAVVLLVAASGGLIVVARRRREDDDEDDAVQVVAAEAPELVTTGS